MATLLTILTLLAQFTLGFALLSLFRLALPRAQRFALSLLLGLGASTVLVFGMECLHVPLREPKFLPTLMAAAVAIQFVRRGMLREWKALFTGWKVRLRPHEVLVIAVIAVRLGALLWRAHYQPLLARDSIVGMDLAAKFAAREGHFVSSLFTSPVTSPELSNQPYYAPFTSFSLLIYRLTGSMFGSFWLAAMSVSVVVLLYDQLRRMSHAILAGLLVLLFLSAPEVFSYTFLVLTDFPCMVFLSAALVVLLQGMETGARLEGRYWGLSALLVGLACWSRSDTVLQVMLLVPVLALFHRREGIRRLLPRLALWAGVAFAFFAAWSFFFVPVYFPDPPAYDTYPDLLNLGRLWKIIAAMVTRVLPAQEGFGYFFLLAAPFVLLIPALMRERRSLFLSCCWLAVFVGLVLTAQIFPDATVAYTLKRGSMKLFVIGMLCIAQSVPVQRLCERVRKWELGEGWKKVPQKE